MESELSQILVRFESELSKTWVSGSQLSQSGVRFESELSQI